ncbi:cyclic nucleotide-binding domain-containing protein [SAR116 cluster bacterium]|nr:cyclic nucleotide-binding domain-containing protein [SAR116 cluster bacterium]
MKGGSLKDALSAVGHLAHLKAGDVLFSTGEPCQNVFLIIQGKVRCDADGKEPLIREDGDMLSLVDLLTGSRHSRTCISVTDVELLFIPKEQINEMLEAADNVMAMTMKASAVRIAIAQEGAPG